VKTNLHGTQLREKYKYLCN